MPESYTKGSTIKCEKCGEEYLKFSQRLNFTVILSIPYVRCPRCGKKHYFNLL